MSYDQQQHQITKRQGRPRLRSSRAAGRTAQSSRTSRTCLSLEGAESRSGSLRQPEAQAAQITNIHLVNAAPKLPGRLGWLPDDVDWLNLDWELLPEQITARQRASTSAASSAVDQKTEQSPSDAQQREGERTGSERTQKGRAKDSRGNHE